MNRIVLPWAETAVAVSDEQAATVATMAKRIQCFILSSLIGGLSPLRMRPSAERTRNSYLLSTI